VACWFTLTIPRSGLVLKVESKCSKSDGKIYRRKHFGYGYTYTLRGRISALLAALPVYKDTHTRTRTRTHTHTLDKLLYLCHYSILFHVWLVFIYLMTDNFHVLTMLSCLCTGRPDPPYDVGLTGCGTLKAIVVWTPGSDNNAPITEYIVYYNTSFDEQDRFTEGARVDASRMTAAVRLRPWTNFTFSVQARNSIGLSERSEFTPTLCTTPPQKPHRNPTDVCTVSRRADQLVITWEVCTWL